MRPPVRAPAIAPAFTLSLLALLACGPGEDASSGSAHGEAFAPLNLHPSVAYAGMDACRSCHLGVHATWAGTGMARSFRSAAGLPDGGALQVIGSGRHVEAVFGEAGGEASPVSACRWPDLERWEACGEGEEHLGTGSPEACSFCHRKAGPREGASSAEGVDCERCHGPGTIHVERWKGTSETGSGAADPTIVNPRRLPHPERMAVCLQCHLGDTRSTARIPRAGRSWEDFRPGMPLGEIWRMFRRASPRALEFGAASQGDRLMLSRCFRESQGRMDCTTCHNPHVTVYHEDRPADLFRIGCLRCHEETDCRTPPDARRGTDPPDDCVTCHMRRGAPYDQRRATYTDHWIRGDPGAEREEPDASCDLETVRIGPAEEPGRAESLYYRARAWAELSRGPDGPACEARLGRALEELAREVAAGFDSPEARELLRSRGR